MGETFVALSGVPASLLGMWAAATVLVIGVISTRPLRRRLRYEVWHRLHSLLYVALGLAFVHQLEETTTFTSPAFATAYLDSVALRVRRPADGPSRHAAVAYRRARRDPRAILCLASPRASYAVGACGGGRYGSRALSDRRHARQLTQIHSHPTVLNIRTNSCWISRSAISRVSTRRRTAPRTRQGVREEETHAASHSRRPDRLRDRAPPVGSASTRSVPTGSIVRARRPDGCNTEVARRGCRRDGRHLKRRRLADRRSPRRARRYREREGPRCLVLRKDPRLRSRVRSRAHG